MSDDPVRAKIGWASNDIEATLAWTRIALATGKVSLGESTLSVERSWPQEGGDTADRTTVVSNGTAALELIFRILKTDVVIVPEMTVPMVAWAAARSGAIVEKRDVDDFLCLNMDAAETVCSAYKKLGKTVTVCYVATGGLINPKAFGSFARLRSMGVKIVLDMSHAHGVTYGGQGLYAHADAASWSFYATKVLTSGEGGIAWFEDKSLADKAKRLSNQGKDRGSGLFLEEGYNYRLAEPAAALMANEVLRSNAFYLARRSVAAKYDAAGIPGVHRLAPALKSTFYKYVLPTTATKYGEGSADQVEEAFRELGVFARVAFTQTMTMGGKPWSHPTARRWGSGHVCLPIDRMMTEEMVGRVVEAWKQIQA